MIVIDRFEMDMYNLIDHDTAHEAHIETSSIFKVSIINAHAL